MSFGMGRWLPGVRFVVVAGVTLSLGCGTPQSGSPSNEGGGTDTLSAADAAGGCNPFGSPMCAQGETCCFTGFSGGACTALGACQSNIQFECNGPSRCATGEVCCATVPGADASATLVAFLQSMQDAGLPDHWPPGIVANSFCAPSCSAPKAALCLHSADCSGGASCEPTSEGDLVLTAVGAEVLGVCVVAERGAVPSEGGAPQGVDASADVSDGPAGD
jgi:hypothetical protein